MHTDDALYLWTGYENILADPFVFKKGVLLHTPTLEIKPCSLVLPDNLSSFQASVITSQHALPSLKKKIFKEIPLWCVGEHTAKCSQEAGFTHVVKGPGTAQSLAQTMIETLCPSKGTLYYPRAEIVRFDLGSFLRNAQFNVMENIVYRAAGLSTFPLPIQHLLKKRKVTGVFFLSCQGVIAFEEMVKSQELVSAFAQSTAFCLSPSVAQEAQRLAFYKVVSAKKPTRACLLNLIECASPPIPLDK